MHPQDLRKHTVCTNNLLHSLLLHTSQQTAMQIQVFIDILSTCNEPTALRCPLEIQNENDLGCQSLKFEGWKRSLKGDAATKYLCNI